MEQLNVERPISRTPEISNIQKINNELFVFIIFDLKKNYICLNYSNIRNVWWFILVKLEVYGILIVFQIFKFAISRNYKNLEIFRIFQIANVSNFPNWKCLDFPKLEFFGIVKINEFLDFFHFVKPKFSNFGIVHPFNIQHYSQYCQFSYLPIDINQLSQFLFFISLSCKFSHSTSEFSNSKRQPF